MSSRRDFSNNRNGDPCSVRELNETPQGHDLDLKNLISFKRKNVFKVTIPYHRARTIECFDLFLIKIIKSIQK